MSTQKAVIIQGPRKASFVTDRDIPKLRPSYMLVRVAAVALNPTDWKHVDFLATENALLGVDYAGTVEETGTGYSKQWEKGDRVYGFVHGGDSTQLENGAFAEHIVVKADIQLRVPPEMSFEAAATAGLGIITVGQGLFQAMKLNLPSSPANEAKPILIYGGSSATGTLGIQLARLAGYTPLTTCSPHNFDLVRSAGAAAAFDYRDSDCAEQIRKYTDNNLKYAWDTIGVKESARICCDALASGPGAHYGSILPVRMPREDVDQTATLAYDAFGEAYQKMGPRVPANDENFEFAKKFATIADDLVMSGRLKFHPTRLMEGGLERVVDGLDLLRTNKISGHKLVYTVAPSNSRL